jgi:hypothetical protein
VQVPAARAKRLPWAGYAGSASSFVKAHHLRLSACFAYDEVSDAAVALGQWQQNCERRSVVDRVRVGWKKALGAPRALVPWAFAKYGLRACGERTRDQQGTTDNGFVNKQILTKGDTTYEEEDYCAEVHERLDRTLVEWVLVGLRVLVIAAIAAPGFSSGAIARECGTSLTDQLELNSNVVSMHVRDSKA